MIRIISKTSVLLEMMIVYKLFVYVIFLELVDGLDVVFLQGFLSNFPQCLSLGFNQSINISIYLLS